MKYLEGLQHHLKEWGSTLLPWVTIVSIFIGGLWAYHKFSITDEAEWNPSIRVSAEAMPYADKELLVIHVRPKNIGKVPISLLGRNKGDISISLNEFPPDHAIGRIKDEELTAVAKIESLVAENSGSYVLEPGVEYNDVQYFVVQKAKMTEYFVVSAELNWPYKGAPESADTVDASTVITVPPFSN